MKITNPLLTKALGLFGATLIRGWTTTLDYRIVYQDPTVDPVHPRCRPRALYILWHEYLICPLGVRGRNMSVLISQHRDGELITQVLRHLGFKVIRGSSTRGGIAAIKKVVRGWGDGQKSAEHATSIREPASDNPSPGANACGFTDSTWSAQCQKGTAHAPLSGASRCAAGVAGTKTMVPDSALSTQHSALSSHHPSTSPPLHLIITPDGPRGPRRQLQEGAVFLAARLGIPIVCMGFAFDRPWRLKSWDQFAIPRPFSRARAVISGYLDIPPVAPGSATGMSRQE